MAEWSNAAVLKTVDVKASGGSNPSLSAEMQLSAKRWAVFIFPPAELARAWEKIKTAIVCHRHTSCNNSARALRRVQRECTARRASPIPLSPQQSGLQISVGHFSCVVSQKMGQILVNWSLFLYMDII